MARIVWEILGRASTSAWPFLTYSDRPADSFTSFATLRVIHGMILQAVQLPACRPIRRVLLLISSERWRGKVWGS